MFLVDNHSSLQCIKYKIFVKNVEKSIDVIEHWRVPGNFDDLAFKNSKSDKWQVKIREISRVG